MDKIDDPLHGSIVIQGNGETLLYPDGNGSVWSIEKLFWSGKITVGVATLNENGYKINQIEFASGQEGPDFQAFYPQPLEVYKRRTEDTSDTLAIYLKDQSGVENKVIYSGRIEGVKPL